jgi:transcriptional regulator with XRE-family HTH domain
MTNPGALRAVRLGQGKSQLAVANAAHISQAAYSYIERGKRIPRTDTLLRIFRALGLSKAEEIIANFVDRPNDEAAGGIE